MTTSRNRKALVVGLLLAIVASVTAVVIAIPSLYRAFSAATAYKGVPQRATASQAAQAAASASSSGASGHTIVVHFDANTDPRLPWRFEPVQKNVTVHLGQPVTVFYKVTNRSNQTLVGRAAYNVIPYQSASYFFMVKCFCFTNERLGPGESARMPIEFYVDHSILKDAFNGSTRDITLSYTFYKQDGLSPAQVAATPDPATAR